MNDQNETPVEPSASALSVVAGSRLQIMGGPLDGAECIQAKKKECRGLVFCWWGAAQAHKWRWNETHIDLGPLSIYGITRPWAWRPLAWAIWPLRKWYHVRHANKYDVPTLAGGTEHPSE